MANLDTIVVAEFGNQGCGHGRATHSGALHGVETQFVLLKVLNEGHPNGGHTGTDGHFFGFNEFVQTGTIQLRTRQDQLGAGNGCRIRNAPRVDMEHGHHRQNGFFGR